MKEKATKELDMLKKVVTTHSELFKTEAASAGSGNKCEFIDMHGNKIEYKPEVTLSIYNCKEVFSKETETFCNN